MDPFFTIPIILYVKPLFMQGPAIFRDALNFIRLEPQQIYFLQGIFNGLLLMMLIHNLFLYISSQDKSYLYYVLYVFFTTVFILHNYGYIQKFIMPESPELNSPEFLVTWNIIFIISLIASYVFYFMLMRVFIGSEEKHPFLYKIITIILYFFVIIAPVLCVINLLDISLYELISRMISVALFPPIITILIIMYIKGDKLSRYFVFGSFALFTGVAYIIFGIILGKKPEDLLYGFQLGVIAQVFIFSLGLSHRYERMNRENIQSKYKALKNQIDPHFFFNSLSVLTSLVYKDSDKSAEYVTQLSKVYRNILDKSKESVVLLENEIKLLDSFIFLMKIRFGDNISFTIDIPDEVKKNAYIPPNTLQLLVENAIKHNKCSSEEPLRILIAGDQNCICVKNNINRRALVNESSGIGLENIRHRFELLGGKKILVNEDKNTFTVVLPGYNKKDYESINI